MRKIAFITSEDDPTLIKDDQLVFAPLKERGYTAFPHIWDHGHTGLETCDAIVFRSCWNYHRKYEQFLSWIEKLKNFKVPVINPIAVNLWNLNKHYLIELADKGTTIPTTKFIEKGTALNMLELRVLIDAIGAPQVVIKPAVSLNGQDTYLVAANDLSQINKIMAELLPTRDMLVQEFVPEIKTSGEVSLIFFNKKYSHAIRKTPAAHEFRIHHEYGGQRASYTPSKELIQQATDIVNLVEGPLVSCRVDVVETPQGAKLIELEIIDPMLFLALGEGAPDRFAQALVDAIAASRLEGKTP